MKFDIGFDSGVGTAARTSAVAVAAGAVAILRGWQDTTPRFFVHSRATLQLDILNILKINNFQYFQFYHELD